MNTTVMVECLGRTLLHFLWQALIVTAILAAYLRLCRNAAPGHCYLAGCFALILLALMPPVTFCYFVQQKKLPSAPNLTLLSAPVLPNDSQIQTSPSAKFIIPTQPAIRKSNVAHAMNQYLPWIVTGWLAGVTMLSLRLLVGWVLVQRLKRIATSTLDEIWQQKLATLARRLGVSRPVKLLQSALVEVPTVIGWLRPVILLPAGCLVGLSPAQLEGILAHELAHIGQHDYLVNLLQSVLETCLFYHPAVWWVSRVVREEREHCCDDFAVNICGDRIEYARALATLEELRLVPAPFALAAGGAPLLERVRRLAGRPHSTLNRPAWPIAAIAAGLMILGIAIAPHGTRAQAEDSKNGPAKATSSGGAIRKYPGLELRTLQSDSETLQRAFNSIDGGSITNAHPATDTEAKKLQIARVRKFLASLGVDMDTNNPANAGKFFNWNEARGIFSMRATPTDWSFFEAAILAFAQPPSGEKPKTNALELRTFLFNPQFFHQWLMNGGVTFDDELVKLAIERTVAETFFKSIGVDFDTNNPANAGKKYGWIEPLGFLMVNATPKELDAIEKAFKVFNPPDIAGTATVRPAPFQSYPVYSALSDPILNELSLNLSHVEQQLVTLKADLGAEHPDVKRILKFQAVLKEQIGLRLNELRESQTARLENLNSSNTALPLSLFPATNSLEVRTFHFDPETFLQGVESVTGKTNAVDELMIHQFFTALGLDFGTNNPANAGKLFAWRDRWGMLTVRAIPQDLDMIDAAIQAFNSSARTTNAESFQPSQKNTNNFEVRTFVIDPANFRQGLESVSGKTNADAEFEIGQFFPAIGVDLGTNNPANIGKWFTWNDLQGILMVRATPQDLDIIDAAIKALNEVPPQVSIKVKFVTMESSTGETWMKSFWHNTNQMAGPISGILSPEAYHMAIEALQRRDDVNELNVPEVVTESGRQVQVQTQVDVAKVSTNLAAPLEPSGPMLDVIPFVLADESTVQLTMIPTLLEFEGYPKGEFVPSYSEDMSGDPTRQSTYALPLPHFRLRQVVSDVTVLDGQTAVVGGLKWATSTNSDKMLIVFVTPTIVKTNTGR